MSGFQNSKMMKGQHLIHNLKRGEWIMMIVSTTAIYTMSMTVECYVCVDGMIKTYVFFRLTWYFIIMADENYNRWIIYMTINTTHISYIHSIYSINWSRIYSLLNHCSSWHLLPYFILSIRVHICRSMKTLI